MRTIFLQEIERGAEGDNRDDDEEAGDIAGGGRERARDKQDNDKRIAKSREKLKPRRRAARGRRIVGTMKRKPSRWFAAEQTCDRCAEPGHNAVEWLGP
jgi:hypothetical protein